MTMTGTYTLLKSLHAGCAAATLGLFIWRTHLSLDGRRIPQRWLRRVPDSVDALLLLSGVALVFVTGQYPFEQAWISIKLLMVVLYIGLGFVVLRFGRTLSARRTARGAALLVFAYIVWLAVSKSPWPAFIS